MDAQLELVNFGIGRRKLHDELFSSEDGPEKSTLHSLYVDEKCRNMVMEAHDFLLKAKFYGIGRRLLHDGLFSSKDGPLKYGIHDMVDEKRCQILTMEVNHEILRKIKDFGTGRRKLMDDLFSSENGPPKLGIQDIDDEELLHSHVTTVCSIPGCTYTAESLLEFEEHYNTNHRYSCQQCKKKLPSPHLLDLHIQETHDSFFAVIAAKKPSYCCYIEDCKEKFMDSDARLHHSIVAHKLPKDFRFDKPKNKKKKKKSQQKPMDVDDQDPGKKEVRFTNSKSKGFPKYTGKKFTSDTVNPNALADIDEIMTDLQQNLPSSSLKKSPSS